MIQVNAMGDACPIPVVKTKNAVKELGEAGGIVETLVDNEIAVQNLTKMANQKGWGVKSEKLGEGEFKVTLAVDGQAGGLPAALNEPARGRHSALPNDRPGGLPAACLVQPGRRKNVVVAVSSGEMGVGDEKLGKTLLKGFLYALGQQDELPATILFYNGGAAMTCEGSPSLEDLKSLEAQGVEVLTCGTCLDFYGLKDKLAVGGVTNMYAIVEKLTGAGLVVKP